MIKGSTSADFIKKDDLKRFLQTVYLMASKNFTFDDSSTEENVLHTTMEQSMMRGISFMMESISINYDLGIPATTTKIVKK